MEIDLSIFAKPITEQLEENGYKFKKESSIDKYNKLIHSWNWCRIHIATDGEADKMAKRLVKKLMEDIEPI
jgi:hypothetical protein